MRVITLQSRSQNYRGNMTILRLSRRVRSPRRCAIFIFLVRATERENKKREGERERESCSSLSFFSLTHMQDLSHIHLHHPSPTHTLPIYSERGAPLRQSEVGWEVSHAWNPPGTARREPDVAPFGRLRDEAGPLAKGWGIAASRVPHVSLMGT